MAAATSSPMQMAVQLAQQAVVGGEVPVGAVIMRDGEVVAQAHNLVITHRDPSAHAEMLVIREACKRLGNERLDDCDLYVTLEPCPMCAAVISFARIRRLYFGAYDLKGGGVENGPRIFSHPTCHHTPEIYGGMMESESAAMLKDFFAKKRAAT